MLLIDERRKAAELECTFVLVREKKDVMGEEYKSRICVRWRVAHGQPRACAPIEDDERVAGRRLCKRESKQKSKTRADNLEPDAAPSQCERRVGHVEHWCTRSRMRKPGGELT